jgi:site-specific recombinase XerC
MTSTTTSLDPAALYVARLGTEYPRRSARSARYALATRARILDLEMIDWVRLSCAAFGTMRAGLNSYSFAWGITCLTVLRIVLAEAGCLDLADRGFFEHVRALPRLRECFRLLERDVDNGETVALFAALDPTVPVGYGDAALLVVLAGVRCGEAAIFEAEASDLSWRPLRVKVGKGRRSRVTPVPGWAAEHLDEWICVHLGDCQLLRPIDLWGRPGESLSPRGVRSILERMCVEAGIERLSPHAIRAHRITEVLDASNDPLIARTLAGHADLSMSARYDRRGFDSLQRVIDSIESPRRIFRLRVVA